MDQVEIGKGWRGVLEITEMSDIGKVIYSGT
jgi:hypothetical protein